MDRRSFKVIVDSRARYYPGMAPHRFIVWERERQVIEVLDRWFSSDHRYLKVKADDGAVYILRYGIDEDEWTLVVYSHYHPTEISFQERKVH